MQVWLMAIMKELKAIAVRKTLNNIYPVVAQMASVQSVPTFHMGATFVLIMARACGAMIRCWPIAQTMTDEPLQQGISTQPHEHFISSGGCIFDKRILARMTQMLCTGELKKRTCFYHFHCQYILLLLIICCPWGVAGIEVYDYYGRPLHFSDRPLLISTYHHLKLTFEGTNMKKTDNQLGFLHFNALASSGIQLNTQEMQIYLKTQKVLTAVKIMKEPVAFNGRVILSLHGSPTGEVVISIGGKESDIPRPMPVDPKTGKLEPLEGFVIMDGQELGVRLGNFFQEYKLNVSRLDLGCCSGKILRGRVLSGLEKSGYNDIELVSFVPDIIRRIDDIDGRKISFFGVRGEEEGERILFPSESFFVHGDVSDFPDDAVSRQDIGVPKPIAPVESAPTQECSIQ